MEAPSELSFGFYRFTLRIFKDFFPPPLDAPASLVGAPLFSRFYLNRPPESPNTLPPFPPFESQKQLLVSRARVFLSARPGPGPFFLTQKAFLLSRSSPHPPLDELIGKHYSTRGTPMKHTSVPSGTLKNYGLTSNDVWPFSPPLSYRPLLSGFERDAEGSENQFSLSR